MRLLLLQPKYVRRYPTPARMRLNAKLWRGVEKLFPAQTALTRIPQQFRARHWIDLFAARLPREIAITSEFNHYGDLPNQLGTANVTAIERYHPAYYEERPENHPGVQWEKYPSNFGFPKPQFTTLSEAERNIHRFDVVLASIRLGRDARPLLRKARTKGVPVALFDNIDHEAVYVDPAADPFREFSSDEFDIFFKKDIPLDQGDQRLIPICPVPTRATPAETVLPWDEREYELSFVGSYRPGTTRRDRLDLCELLGRAFSKAKFLVNQAPISLSEQDELARRTRILVSPSGRVWCSFRHADYGRMSAPVLMPRPNCRTAGPDFVDMDNAILYDTRVVQREHRLVDHDTLVDRIRTLLTSPERALSIGRQHRLTVNSGHTTAARAMYIADTLKQRFAL